ncbi:hypothetical protein DEU56DRAFT_810483 [Suillus clintonianus]|uniref:uncharacterized protein n=1 Tax=Suillus clintonianus TaxID=1904413 RepID=UPI001B87B54C|nr:uncharacterized protein DEU56DRAFT_810483 [Suillus clintonianus]KAG2133747.1 hypothetical protein DEU56DRAFT_810483 [Suillus clintonianus]
MNFRYAVTSHTLSPGHFEECISQTILAGGFQVHRQGHHWQPFCFKRSTVLLHPQTSQVLSLLTTTNPEPKPDRSSDLLIAKFLHQAEQPDPKFVKATLSLPLVNAKTEFEGVKHVSGMVENTASASDNIQSVLNTIDRFSAILGPLKVFNSVANGLADVQVQMLYNTYLPCCSTSLRLCSASFITYSMIVYCRMIAKSNRPRFHTLHLSSHYL